MYLELFYVKFSNIFRVNLINVTVSTTNAHVMSHMKFVEH